MKLSFEQKENNYTALLFEAAKKIGCVFYEDCGEGRDCETETMYMEDVGGWLAPIGTSEEEAKTDDNYRFAEWQITEDNKVIIDFVKYD